MKDAGLKIQQIEDAGWEIDHIGRISSSTFFKGKGWRVHARRLRGEKLGGYDSEWQEHADLEGALDGVIKMMGLPRNVSVQHKPEYFGGILKHLGNVLNGYQQTLVAQGVMTAPADDEL